MKNTLYIVTAVFLTFVITTTLLAQESPQWNIPDEASARIGKGKIHQIIYSPDDTMLAVATGIGIWLYDAQTGDEIDLLVGHTEPVRAVAFTRDGTKLASGSEDETIRLWDVPNRSHLRTLTGHTSTIRSLAFSPDGNTLVSGSSDRSARLWDVATGTEKQQTLQIHSMGISSVAFNNSGTRLAVGSSDDTIRLYAIPGYTREHTITANIEGVYDLTFSPTEDIIAAGGNNTIRLWNINTGRQMFSYKAHTHYIETLTFSKDGKKMVSGSRDGTIRVGSAKSLLTTKLYREQSGWITTIALNSDGTRFVSGSTDGTLLEWNGLLTSNQGQVRTLARHGDFGDTLVYASNGNVIASGSNGGDIYLWQFDNGKYQMKVFTGHTDDVSGVAFSPDGKLLVSGSHDRTMRVWDVETGFNLHTFVRSIGYITDVAFSPNGEMVAYVSQFQGSTIGIYDAKLGEQINVFDAWTLPPLSASPWPIFLPLNHTRSVSNIEFSPDSKTIATCSYDDTVRLWDVETGKHKHVFRGHTDTVYDIAYSPDGKTIASGSADMTIRLWDIPSGTILRTLTGHTNVVRTVTFSPDGRTLASGGWDDVVNLWDVGTGTQLRTITGHTASVNAVAFHPDGHTLASNSSDGTILLWDILPTEISSTTVSLSPASVESPDVGERITLNLHIMDGVDVAGYQATVIFDNSALSYVEITHGDYLTANSFALDPVTTENSVRIGAVSFGGAQSSMNGIFASITFDVLAVKNSTVRLSNVLLTNNMGIASVPQIVSAEITVPILLPEDVNKDGVVDISDLVLVATNFGKSGENAADVNDDGVVDIIDLALVAAKIHSHLNIDIGAPGFWSLNTGDMPTRSTVASWLREARSLNLPDPEFQSGILFLEKLLASLTPTDTALLPNYPNPFNPETWIPYQLATPADVSIVIYASDGKLVRQLDIGYQTVGIYQHRSSAAYWDGRNSIGEPVASGVYFYTLTAGNFSATRKMLIRK